MINRRAALAVLGIAAPGSAAAAIEGLGSASDHEPKCNVNFAIPSKTIIVDALRALADEIEAERAGVTASSLVTEIKPEEFVVHKLSIDFFLTA